MHFQRNPLHFHLPRHLNKVERYIVPETGDVTPEATEQMNTTKTERMQLSLEIRNQIPKPEAIAVAEPVAHEVKSGDSLTKIIGKQFPEAYKNSRLMLLSSAYMDKQGREQAEEGVKAPNVHFLDIGDKILFDPEHPGQVMIQRKDGSSAPNIDWIQIFPQESLEEKEVWTEQEALESGLVVKNDEGLLPKEGYDWADPDLTAPNYKVIPEKVDPRANSAPAPDPNTPPPTINQDPGGSLPPTADPNAATPPTAKPAPVDPELDPNTPPPPI